MANSSDAIRAGYEALESGAWVEARRAFEQALSEDDSPEALEGLGMAAWWLDDAPVVFDTRQRAYQAYRRRSDRRAAARVAIALAEDSLYFRGETAVAQGWHRRAERLLEGVPPSPEHAWLKASQGDFAFSVRGDPQEARRLAAEGVAIARALEVLDAEMVALALEGLTLVAEGRFDEGMSRLDEAATASLAGELTDHASATYCCCYLMRACQTIRDVDRAAQWCARVKALSERLQSNALFASCRSHYAAVLLWSGAWSEAEEELETAALQFQTARPAMEGDALVVLAELRRRQGRVDQARALLQRAAGHPLAVVGEALLALDEGDAAAAARLAERFLRLFPEANRAALLTGREVLLRARAVLGDVETCAELAQGLEEAAGEIGTSAARAAARFGSGMAAAAASDFEAARRAFEDAVDLFGRSSAPFEQAQARIELARVLAAAGESAGARSEAQAALQILERLGASGEMERAQRLLGDTGGPAPVKADERLTPREIEVLRLLAQGKTNSDIAGQLVVSDFTVKRHVANILNKLDLPSRAAAAAYAVRQRLV